MVEPDFRPRRGTRMERDVWLREEMGFRWDAGRRVYVHPDSGVVVRQDIYEARVSIDCFQRAVFIAIRRQCKRLSKGGK